MVFEKKWLGDLRNTTPNVFTIWLNGEEKEEILELGLRIRQSKVSTIVKQAVKLALAKITVEEKITEILLDNERKNRRSGLEEVEILRNELIKNLKKNDKSKSDFE
jgi:hypothetical protein